MLPTSLVTNLAGQGVTQKKVYMNLKIKIPAQKPSCSIFYLVSKVQDQNDDLSDLGL